MNKSGSVPGSQTLGEGKLFANRYHIVRQVGTGGMGDVYLATDTMLNNEEVALKVLHPHLSRDEKHARRFLREVQLTRKVTHPNVIRTFDVGEQHGVYHLTMEYVDGRTLKDLLSGGPIDAEMAFVIARQMSDGLQAIHEQGIIHRDLKPANVILLPNGQIKIADFGVARSNWSDLTGENEVVGSAPYMAPELWTHNDGSARSDIYAFGVLLYEMVTGVTPFEAETPAGMMCRHLEAAPAPPSELVPSIPAWCDRFIFELLQKDPTKRPQSIVAMMTLLDELRVATAAPPPEPPHSVLDATEVPPPLDEQLPSEEISAEILCSIRDELSKVQRIVAPNVDDQPPTPSRLQLLLERSSLARLTVRAALFGALLWLTLGPLSTLADIAWDQAHLRKSEVGFKNFALVMTATGSIVAYSALIGSFIVMGYGVKTGALFFGRLFALNLMFALVTVLHTAFYFGYSMSDFFLTVLIERPIRVTEFGLSHLFEVVFMVPKMRWYRDTAPGPAVEFTYGVVVVAFVFFVVSLFRREIYGGSMRDSLPRTIIISILVLAPRGALMLAEKLFLDGAPALNNLLVTVQLGALKHELSATQLVVSALSWLLLVAFVRSKVAWGHEE